MTEELDTIPPNPRTPPAPPQTPKTSRVAIDIVDELAGLERAAAMTLSEAASLARSLGDDRRVTFTITVVEPGKLPIELCIGGTGRDVRLGFSSFCSGLLLANQPDVQVQIGSDVLQATVQGSKLQLGVQGRRDTPLVGREWFLIEWNSALNSLLGEGINRLAHRPLAGQVFSLDWALPSYLYGSGTPWYGGGAETQQAFPLDPAPKTKPDAPLSELLKEVLGYGPIVPYAALPDARENASAYWIGGAAPDETERMPMRLAMWQSKAPPGSEAWMIEGERLFVVRTLKRGASTFIDTWRHTVPTLGSRGLMKERLERFNVLSRAFTDPFVLDHGELRVITR